MVGELERIFSLFLVGVFAGGYLFGAEVVGEVVFCWQKIGLVRKLAGGTSKRG